LWGWNKSLFAKLHDLEEEEEEEEEKKKMMMIQ
jgi:hypothetical protein